MESSPPGKKPKLEAGQRNVQTGQAARDLLSGALSDAIKIKEESEETVKDESKKVPVQHNLTNGKTPEKSIRLRYSTFKSFASSRRKKKVESLEGGEFHHTFVMRLFDRSVDLAQFRSSTPLYPLCRAWMKNEPTNTNQLPKERTPTPQPPDNHTNLNDIDSSIYKLPPPIKLESSPSTYTCPRIPSSSQLPAVEKVNLNLGESDHTPPAILLSNHMVRWWGVKKAWKQSYADNEKRYSKSLELLKEIFDGS